MSTKVCPKCNFDIHPGGYKRHVSWCDGKGPRRRRPPHDGVCRHCGKSGFKLFSLGGHVASCLSNPNHEERSQKLSNSMRGKRFSEERKKKLSESIRKKIHEGTWHLSFSKSRTHIYSGVKLHGTWEVKYAMYLDNNQIVWRRPTEKFPYTFNEKDSYYTPDFYLEQEDCYVEIKGYRTSRDEAKWSQFPAKLKVLEGKDLVQLGILDVDSVCKDKNIPT